LFSLAFPTIVIDFIYQVTFFISLIVLDERRIQANRKDICIWSVAADKAEDIQEADTFPDNGGSPINLEVTTRTITEQSSTNDLEQDGPQKIAKPKKSRRGKYDEFIPQREHFADRFMYWFALRLLRPVNQAIVIVVFLLLLSVSLIAATKLKQEFNYIDMVPADSYLKDYMLALDDYTNRNGLYVYVFFRDVDQSSPEVRQQMLDYVDDLTDSKAIAHYPVYFWLRDFNLFLDANNATLGDLTFNEQIASFLKDPGWEELYGEHIVVREDGSVFESRCVAYVDVNIQVTKDGTDMLKHMREIDSRQPINQGQDEWTFLSYSDEYHIFEYVPG
jgi:Patched family